MLKRFASLLLITAFVLTGCGAAPTEEATPQRPLVISAIPDQDPEKLQRLYESVASYLSTELGVPVIYKPVVDYTASVTAFKVGDLDLVWYGGLTGVQARLQVEGAQAIVQRDIDASFHSVFIAHVNSGIEPCRDIQDLQVLKGRTFTFGSDSSTSGRLMPQYFLKQAGVTLEDFSGEAGFSGSHDKTIKLVESGTYDAGALNEQVWESRVKAGEVDTSMVTVIWRSPAYYDYHWVLHPNAAKDFGADLPEKIKQALLKLNPDVPEHKAILDLFGAGKFIATENANYAEIEAIAREIGKIK
ncbi:MAG: putative selenate ABC transporter substrate-binding protein [Anaerolineae bacterium]|nr:putative selenate ABC transporter substrate-binding protein [Anaerolineae bacterium]